MHFTRPIWRSWCLFLGTVALLSGATRDLGRGFSDHGVATPLSQHRGMVATADGAGRDVMLVWLYDHRGGYSLLMIDAETGRSEQFATPYSWEGDGPFASILSSGNKYYTHFGSHFSEFDPVKRAFTFHAKTVPQMAMSMTEADDGTIWSATYPNSALASFNPAKREFKDYRSLNKENWRQYPRSLAVDDAGWVYVGIGSAQAQVMILDPASGKARAALDAGKRGQGYGAVYRLRDGKVYAQLPGKGAESWREFYRGESKVVTARTVSERKTIIAGDQGLFHAKFPSGKIAKGCDTVEKTLVVFDPKTKTTKTVKFDYVSEGAHLVAVAAAPDGTMSGGTAFPMRMFSYEPKADGWKNWPAHGQFNTVARQGNHFFVGGYPHGFLLEWNSEAAWAATTKSNAGGNPRYLTECEPTINRPHDLLPLRDGRTVVLAGTPGYGYTGGGVLIWDRESRQRTLLSHTDLLPQLSTMSLVELADGQVLGGTTIAGGTGGEAKAKLAELYVLDVATKKIIWHAAALPGVQTYTDLTAGPNGLVYGFADSIRFFVFDPAKRAVVHAAAADPKFGRVVTGQGPRGFVAGPGGAVYVLFTKGIVRVEPSTFNLTWLADAPVPISAGGEVLEGRVYFAGGSHLYSYRLPE